MPVDIRFNRLADPTSEVASAFTKWENDPALVYLARPNASQEDLERKTVVTMEELQQRLEHTQTYLIYLEGQLVGEMSFQIDPQHLYKKEPGTAWIGITIGEESARGKGLGLLAMQHLEDEIRKAGCKRIELGVFEFNIPAQTLYQKMGYVKIGRIPDFTFWQDKRWADIRMEKYLST
jgi:RimJ/RimL family protein N-acetyltransferase